MNQLTDHEIFLEYARAFKAPSVSGVIDLDKRFGEKIDCFATRIEEVIDAVGPDIPPYRLSKFAIIYLSTAAGEKTVGLERFKLQDRTLVVIPNHVVSSSAYVREVTTGYYLSFNLRFFLQSNFPSQFMKTGNLFNPATPFLYLNEEDGNRIEGIFNVIFEENSKDNYAGDELVSIKIFELLILMNRLMRKEDEPEKYLVEPLVDRYNLLITRFYNEQHNVGFYAERLAMHPNVLNAAVKRSSGLSAKQLLDSKIANESRQLLAHSNLSIKEIAYQLGFSSPTYFNRFFKRHTGLTPAAFRLSLFENVP